MPGHTPEETLYDKAKKSNDDFHEAVNNVLMDEGLDVDKKVKFGMFANTTFSYMKQALDVVKEHYEPEE